MQAVIVQDFTFEAAHSLPGVGAGHPCRRVHGHTYKVSVHVEGPLDPDKGWVMDFHDLEAAVAPVLGQLDHRMLNELDGLANPTAEIIAHWIWSGIEPHLPGLCQVDVWENHGSRAVVRACHR